QSLLLLHEDAVHGFPILNDQLIDIRDDLGGNLPESAVIRPDHDSSVRGHDRPARLGSLVVTLGIHGTSRCSWPPHTAGPRLEPGNACILPRPSPRSIRAAASRFRQPAC